MNFNILFFVLSIFFSSTQETEKGKTNDFYEISLKKKDDYFSLDKKLNTISLEEINILHKQSISQDYKIGQIYALNRLGVYHKNNKNYHKSIDYHNQALDLSKSNNLSNIEMICLNLIGKAYVSQDDIRNAIVYHQSVIYLAKQIKNKTLENKKSISIAKNSLGNIYNSLQQYYLAIEHFKDALILQKDIKDLNSIAINHQNIGNTYENLELFDQALENYKISLEYNTKLNSDLGKVISYNSIASIAIKQGDYAKSLSISKQILPTSKKLKDKYYTAETLSNLGWSQVKLNDNKNALDNLKKALSIVKKNKNYLQNIILNHLSELYEKKGEFEKSIFYYKEAGNVENKITKKRNNIYIQNLTTKKNLQTQRRNLLELKNATEIKSLQLARNRNILIITLITIALLTAVLYSVYRQHLLKNDQKTLLLKQQALQTQMNPHFVFNALNSIKLYIINNEQKNAVYYLNKFSKLIRNILEVSKVKEVSLKEELNTMGLYMSIENIRFDNTITYIEKVHSNLNTETIKLPPLILQPFLENAIWHGLSSKENGPKEIILSAEKISDQLIEINISDNGIGRKTALEIKASKSIKRKSVGIDLTKERLTTFFNESLTEFSLKYSDLKDTEGNPIGTKVSIQIPLILS